MAGSLADFDAAYAADASLRPYLWQRGISAYYAEVCNVAKARLARGEYHKRCFNPTAERTRTKHANTSPKLRAATQINRRALAQSLLPLTKRCSGKRKDCPSDPHGRTLARQAFEAGAAQFREDVAVNPNDTEEAIWAFLCEARLRSADDARAAFLQVISSDKS